jgi:hypothetical protein
MDIETETQKIESKPLIRYGILAIGLVLFFFSQGILTWKNTSARDASGKVDAIQLQISKIDMDINKSEDADEKKDMREEIEDCLPEGLTIEKTLVLGQFFLINIAKGTTIDDGT